MSLRLARNDAGAWQLIDTDGVAIRHGLTPEPQAPIGPVSARLFQWHLVTRRVRSGAGAVPSELPKSILSVANATDFREVDAAEPLAADETDLIARVLLVQRSPNAPVTGNRWQRLFPQPDATGEARDAQLRIVGISPRVKVCADIVMNGWLTARHLLVTERQRLVLPKGLPEERVVSVRPPPVCGPLAAPVNGVALRFWCTLRSREWQQ